MKRKEFLCTPLGEKIEHQIRYALGQRLKGSELKHTNHLRFNMSGERDSIDGFYHNISVLNLFNFPIAMKPSYLDWGIYYANNFEYYLVFHKGAGTMYKKEDAVICFSGLGTVEIIIELCLYFNKYDNFIR